MGNGQKSKEIRKTSQATRMAIHRASGDGYYETGNMGMVGRSESNVASHTRDPRKTEHRLGKIKKSEKKSLQAFAFSTCKLSKLRLGLTIQNVLCVCRVGSRSEFLS